MNLKELIDQINQELTALKTTIITKLQQKEATLTQTQEKLTTASRQVETLTKENSANEATLTTLLHSMQALSQELDN